MQPKNKVMKISISPKNLSTQKIYQKKMIQIYLILNKQIIKEMKVKINIY